MLRSHRTNGERPVPAQNINHSESTNVIDYSSTRREPNRSALGRPDQVPTNAPFREPSRAISRPVVAEISIPIPQLIPRKGIPRPPRSILPDTREQFVADDDGWRSESRTRTHQSEGSIPHPSRNVQRQLSADRQRFNVLQGNQRLIGAHDIQLEEANENPNRVGADEVQSRESSSFIVLDSVFTPEDGDEPWSLARSIQLRSGRTAQNFTRHDDIGARPLPSNSRPSSQFKLDPPQEIAGLQEAFEIGQSPEPANKYSSLKSGPDHDFPAMDNTQSLSQFELALANVSHSIDQCLDGLPSQNRSPKRRIKKKEMLLADVKEKGLAVQLAGNNKAIRVLTYSYIIELRLRKYFPHIPMREVDRLIASLIADDQNDLPDLIEIKGQLYQSSVRLLKKHAVIDAVEIRSQLFSSEREKNQFADHVFQNVLVTQIWNHSPEQKAQLALAVDKALLSQSIEALGHIAQHDIPQYVDAIISDETQSIEYLLSDQNILNRHVGMLSVVPRLTLAVDLVLPHISQWAGADVATIVSSLCYNHRLETLEALLAEAFRDNFIPIIRTIATPLLEARITRMLGKLNSNVSPQEVLDHILRSTGHTISSLAHRRELLKTGVLQYHLANEIMRQLSGFNVTSNQRDEIIHTILDGLSVNSLYRLARPDGLRRLQHLVGQQYSLIRRVERDAVVIRFEQAVRVLGIDLSNHELVSLTNSLNRRELAAHTTDRNRLLSFVRRWIDPQGKNRVGVTIRVRNGYELRDIARKVSRYPGIRNPYFSYYSDDWNTRQRGIDYGGIGRSRRVGGLGRQAWTASFEQVAKLPVVRSANIDEEDFELRIVPSKHPSPTDLVDARSAGHVVAGALINDRYNSISYLQTFSNQVYEGFDHLNFSVNSAALRERSVFRDGGLVHKLYHDCVEPTGNREGLSSINIDPQTLSATNATEFVALVTKFLPELDWKKNNHAQKISTLLDNDVEKARHIIKGIIEATGEEDLNFFQYIQEQLEPLCHFISGFYDVLNPSLSYSTNLISDQVKRIVGGKTIYEQISGPARGLFSRYRSDIAFVRVEIEAGAFTGLNINPITRKGQSLVAKHLKKMFIRYVSEECHPNSPETYQRAIKLCHFITGSKTVDPRKPITLKVVSEVTIGTNPTPQPQPRQHACFSTIDIPLLMLEGLSARGEGRCYQQIKTSMNNILETYDALVNER